MIILPIPEPWNQYASAILAPRGENNGKMGEDAKGYGGAGNQTMLAVEIPLIVLAICTVVLRAYSRIGIKRRLAADDVLIILGTICAFGRTVISCLSADDTWGFDIRGPDRPSEIPYYQHIFERRIAYIFAVSFTRMSIIAYYLRIFPPQLRTLRVLCYVLLFLAVCQFAEVFTVLIVFCRAIPKLWTSDYLSFSGSQCFSSSTYSYSAAIGDSILDCLIFALPIPYVWRLSKLRARQRFGLIVIFALGFTVCVVALLQIPFIRRREGNANYFGGAINMLIAIQVSLAIIAASLPDLRALVARSFPNFSPLHHRSLATGLTRGGADRERRVGMGVVEGVGVEIPRSAFDAKRGSRRMTPDWMRADLPASLMESRITMSELTRAETELERPRPVHPGIHNEPP